MELSKTDEREIFLIKRKTDFEEQEINQSTNRRRLQGSTNKVTATTAKHTKNVLTSIATGRGGDRE